MEWFDPSNKVQNLDNDWDDRIPSNENGKFPHRILKIYRINHASADGDAVSGSLAQRWYFLPITESLMNKLKIGWFSWIIY